MPLSFTLISDHFQGKELTKMMGYNTAFSNIGGIITMLLAGYLATYNWRVPFNVYWMGVGIFILVLMYLPKNEPIKRIAGVKKAKIPLSVYGYALAAGGVMLAYYAVATNMALYLKQSGLGGSGTGGLVISFTTVGGMVTSLTLVRLQFFFKKHLMTAALLSMGIAFGILTFSQSVPIILISVCMVGFGQGIIFPIINDTVLGNVDRAVSDRVISIVSSMIYVGQFLSPVVLDTFGKLAGNSEIRFQYSVLSICLLVAVAVMIVLKLVKRNQEISE